MVAKPETEADRSFAASEQAGVRMAEAAEAGLAGTVLPTVLPFASVLPIFPETQTTGYALMPKFIAVEAMLLPLPVAVRNEMQEREEPLADEWMTPKLSRKRRATPVPGIDTGAIIVRKILLDENVEPLRHATPAVALAAISKADVVAAVDALGVEAAAEALLAQPIIPSRLDESFRSEVFLGRNLAMFGPRLRAAVESSLSWGGTVYSPLKLWTAIDCRAAWAAASRAERDRWDQAVMEILQAYCLLRRLDNGEAVCEADGLAEFMSKIRDGTATFTVMRKACKALTKLPDACKDTYLEQVLSLLPEE